MSLFYEEKLIYCTNRNLYITIFSSLSMNKGRKITGGKYHKLRKKKFFERKGQERQVSIKETKRKKPKNQKEKKLREKQLKDNGIGQEIRNNYKTK